MSKSKIKKPTPDNTFENPKPIKGFTINAVGDEMDENDDEYIGNEWRIGYNDIKFPKAMEFVPDLSYCLIEEDDLKNHPRYWSIKKRTEHMKGYIKLQNMIKGGGKIPEKLWPIVPQGTKAWFGIRTKGFLTGSMVSTFIGFKLSKYRKKLGLSIYYEENDNGEAFDRITLKEKYERPKPGLTQSVFMAWGDHEINAIYTLMNYYTNASVEEWGFKSFDKRYLPEAIKGSDFINKWLPNMGASPDGIVTNLWGKRWLLEVKCPTPFFPNNKKPLDGFFFKVYEPKIKTIYIPQMFIQSLVWGIRNVLHVIYTVEYTYIYKLEVNEKALCLLIRIICKSHKNFVRIMNTNGKGGIPSSLDTDLMKFIEYCNRIVKVMKKDEIKFKSINNQIKYKKYLHTRNYKNKK